MKTTYSVNKGSSLQFPLQFRATSVLMVDTNWWLPGKNPNDKNPNFQFFVIVTNPNFRVFVTVTNKVVTRSQITQTVMQDKWKRNYVGHWSLLDLYVTTFKGNLGKPSKKKRWNLGKFPNPPGPPPPANLGTLNCFFYRIFGLYGPWNGFWEQLIFSPHKSGLTLRKIFCSSLYTVTVK